MSRYLPQNVFSCIALLLFIWTAFNWITLSIPGLFAGNSDPNSYPVGIAPFVAIDQLFPNPDNDGDGPFVIGMLFLPITASIFAAIGYYSSRAHKHTDRPTETLWQIGRTLLVVFAVFMLLGLVASVFIPMH
jgi:hypothetical protein